MAKEAKLYQRLDTPGHPWMKLDVAKNGTARPHADAVQFGIRYTLNGKRRMDTVDTLGQALTMLKARNVAFYAASQGTTIPGIGEQKAKTPMAEAVTKYKANLVSRGLDQKSIKVYTVAVNQFVESCNKQYVEDVTKQDMLDFMGWLRKQPQPKRKHGNPERTYFNKVGHAAIFLKAYGLSGLLKKNEYPSYEEKTVSAHSDEELEILYAHANSEERFLLDYFLGSGVRDGEAAHAEYTDLRGTILEIKGKPHLGWKPKKHHCRKITVTQSLADAIRERQKHSKSPLIFPNGGGRPNLHLLRDLQDLATRAGAKFHTELHKMRKTTATRWAVANIPVHVIQKLLGHKKLETTQRYLADVDLSSDQMKAGIEAATYRAKPALKVVAKAV
jgi:integrase